MGSGQSEPLEADGGPRINQSGRRIASVLVGKWCAGREHDLDARTSLDTGRSQGTVRVKPDRRSEDARNQSHLCA